VSLLLIRNFFVGFLNDEAIRGPGWLPGEGLTETVFRGAFRAILPRGWPHPPRIVPARLKAKSREKTFELLNVYCAKYHK